MVKLEKNGDSAIRFTFTDSDHYLYKDGYIDVPINSLSLVIDESEMVTFKKSATGDPFISFRADNSNLGTKEAIEQFYKENMVGAGGGISEEEVQDMIDSATSGIPSSQVVEQLRTDVNTISANTYTKTQIDGFLSNSEGILTTISGDVQTNAANIADIYDTIDEKEEVIASALTEVRQDVADIDAKEEVIASALTEVRQNVDTLSGDVQTKVATSDFNAYSAATATAIGNKQDALVFYSENEYDEEKGEEATAVIQVIGQGDSSGNSAVIDVQPYTVALSASSEGEDPMSTTLVVTSDDVTINEERVLTEADLSAVTAVSNDLNTLSGNVLDNEYTVSQSLNDLNSRKLDASAYTPTDLSQYWTSAQTQSAIDDVKAYFIDLNAIMSSGGLTDADWDGAIAAVNAHRPVYIKFYNSHYILESYHLDDNTMYLSASDGIAASLFTITKNGSNDYSLNRAIRGFVSDAQTEAWNAKQDALTAGSGIEISGNVISAIGGGSVTVDPTLDSGSTNPVANSAITTALNEKQDSSKLPYGILNFANSYDSNRYLAFLKADRRTGAASTDLISFARINDKGLVGSNDVFSLVETSAITTSMTSSSTDAQVPSAKAVYDALGGLKLVKISQADYSAMEQAGTLDNSTLYIVTNVGS